MTADTAEREDFEKWRLDNGYTVNAAETVRNAWRGGWRARAPEGWVLVPDFAMKWLFGEGPDDRGFWFGDAEAPRAKGAFWWRNDLRRMLSAAPTGAESEKTKAVILYRLAEIIAPDLEGWISPEDTPATWEAALEIAAKIAGLSAAPPPPEQKEEKPKLEIDKEALLKRSCDDQFRLASELAANVGYVLVPEPEFPDSPHREKSAASPAPGPAEPVVLKPLEWKNYGPLSRRAETPFGPVFVYQDGGWYVPWAASGNCDNIEDGVGAVLTILECCVRAVLAPEALARLSDLKPPQPAPAPVAAQPQPSAEAVAVRFGFDGDGYMYLDSGSGSDWLTRYPDAEHLYTAPPPASDERVAAMRDAGWCVAVHNDYRVDGERYTFWLWTHPSGRWIKGEGRTDEDALAQCFAALPLDGEG